MTEVITNKTDKILATLNDSDCDYASSDSDNEEDLLEYLQAEEDDDTDEDPDWCPDNSSNFDSDEEDDIPTSINVSHLF